MFQDCCLDCGTPKIRNIDSSKMTKRTFESIFCSKYFLFSLQVSRRLRFEEKKRLFKVKEQFCRNGWEGERCCCSYFQTLDIDPCSAAAAPRLGRPRPLWVHVRLLFKFNLISLFSGRARRRKPRREISYGSVNWISVSSTFLFRANKSIGSQLSRSNEILKGHLLNYRKTHQSMTWY